MPMQETQEKSVQSLGREYPLEEELATHSSILSRKIPWTEEPGGLQFMIIARQKNVGRMVGSTRGGTQEVLTKIVTLE